VYRLDQFKGSEVQTTKITLQKLAGVASAYPKIIDMLLIIPQLVPHHDSDIEEHTFFFFAHYLQAPSTTSCIYNCFVTGNYLESIILMRHLLEAFIQMRYFRRHLDSLGEHVRNEKRILFKTMFDEFSPGYYKNYYGQQFSEAAHGVVFKALIRTDGELKQDGGKAVLGNRYDEKYASYVINNLTAILSGYFNRIDELLPRNRIKKDPEIARQFDGLKSWMNSAIEKLEEFKIGPGEAFKHFKLLFK
jgi:hypothetical protein